MQKLYYVIAQGYNDTGKICVKECDGVYITPCVYCGMPASSIDHIPPRHMRRQFSAIDLSAVHEREVPACLECNSALGARPLLTITERRDYVKAWLRRRYTKYLKIPNWTDAELLELGENLRRMIQRNIAVRDDVRNRIAWRSRLDEPTKRDDMRVVPTKVHPKKTKVATVLLKPMPVERMGTRKPQSKKREQVSPTIYLQKVEASWVECHKCKKMFHVRMAGQLSCSAKCRGF